MIFEEKISQNDFYHLAINQKFFCFHKTLKYVGFLTNENKVSVYLAKEKDLKDAILIGEYIEGIIPKLSFPKSSFEKALNLFKEVTWETINFHEEEGFYNLVDFFDSVFRSKQ